MEDGGLQRTQLQSAVGVWSIRNKAVRVGIKSIHGAHLRRLDDRFGIGGCLDQRAIIATREQSVDLLWSSTEAPL